MKNSSMRMLRLILCLYMGFGSTGVQADELNNIMDARAIAAGVVSAADVAARNKKTEAEVALLEKAWSCNPVFDESFSWKRSDNQSFQESLNGPPPLLKFTSCSDQDVSEEMRKLIIGKYVKFHMRHVVNGELLPELLGFSYSEAEQKFGDVDYILSVAFVNNQKYESDKNAKIARDAEREIERKRAAEEAAQKEAIKMHMAGLKSGAIPVSSFEDATLLYAPKSMMEVMNSPLLRPDNLVYAGKVLIEEEEPSGLRVRIGGGRDFFGGWVEAAYADFRITKKTKNYSQNAMGIGGVMKVIGRYVKNKKYMALTGEGKTMPVIDIMYIGD